MSMINRKVFRLAGAFVAMGMTSCVLAAMPFPPDPLALASVMAQQRVVVLGEVHDNAAQHALRLAALKLMIERGARPALAFEQFDRERQADIERARRERPKDADYVIAQGRGAPSWRWELYRPFVQLALDHDLPIVAANLSRGEAMRAALAGPGAVPAAPTAAFLAVHEDLIRKGHCDLLPAEAVPGMARAQIARDVALAAAIRPWFARGVVLLTGNGHARIDIGVPAWFAPDERAASVSIGILERDEDESEAEATRTYGNRFDAFTLTQVAPRPDPCEELKQRMRPPASG
jgi:uncharacterized iron-regulated protein